MRDCGRAESKREREREGKREKEREWERVGGERGTVIDKGCWRCTRDLFL